MRVHGHHNGHGRIQVIRSPTQDSGPILDMILLEEWQCDLVRDLSVFSLVLVRSCLGGLEILLRCPPPEGGWTYSTGLPLVTDGPARVPNRDGEIPRAAAARSCEDSGCKLKSESRQSPG